MRLRVDPAAIGRVDGEPVPYSGGWTYPVFFEVIRLSFPQCVHSGRAGARDQIRADATKCNGLDAISPQPRLGFAANVAGSVVGVIAAKALADRCYLCTQASPLPSR